MSMTPLNVTSPRNITVANYPSLALKPLVLPFAPCKLPMAQPHLPAVTHHRAMATMANGEDDICLLWPTNRRDPGGI